MCDLGFLDDAYPFAGSGQMECGSATDDATADDDDIRTVKVSRIDYIVYPVRAHTRRCASVH